MSDLKSQTFVGFSNDLIDHGFHVLGAFPDHKLAIGTCTFAHDPLDMRHLGVIARFTDARAV